MESPPRTSRAKNSPAREALGSIPWLAEVSEPTLDALAAHAMLHRLPAGSMAFEQAETPAFAMFLVSGSLKLLGVREQTEAVIDVAQPFDFVLPAAVIADQPYLLRARVLEDVQLLLIAAGAFRDAMASDNALCRAVLGFVATQLRRQLRAAKSFRLRSAEERVAAYILDQIRRNEGAAELTLAAEKSEIASHLGMTRETFSRTLSSLSFQGVSTDGRRLRVADVAAFQVRFPSDPFIDGAETVAPLRSPAKSEGKATP
jgi:CRP/FNR family transcriptional regulator, transcriptional activator FtrB